MNKRIPALALAFALAACSSVNTAYFTLPDSQFELPAGQGNEVALQVILAEPLATGGLVYQTDPLHLNFAKQNLWAAPLDQSIAANLANKLNRQSKRYPGGQDIHRESGRQPVAHCCAAAWQWCPLQGDQDPERVEK